jgi:hypothetical protein
METNKELGPIETAIKLSKVVIHLKILLHRLRQNLMYMNATPLIVFHEGKTALDMAINDVQYSISITEQRIYGYIKPFLKDDEYNYPGKYSFSAKELVQGFATLEKILQKSTDGKILQSMPVALLLSKHKDDSEILPLKAGTVLSFEGHKDILSTLESVITQKELESFLKPNYSCTFNIEHLIPKE